MATREQEGNLAAQALKYRDDHGCRIALGDVEAWLAGLHLHCLWAERRETEATGERPEAQAELGRQKT